MNLNRTPNIGYRSDEESDKLISVVFRVAAETSLHVSDDEIREWRQGGDQLSPEYLATLTSFGPDFIERIASEENVIAFPLRTRAAPFMPLTPNGARSASAFTLTKRDVTYVFGQEISTVIPAILVIRPGNPVQLWEIWDMSRKCSK